MEKKVVVVVPVERLYHAGRKMHATRVRALGLTAYGDTRNESTEKVKQMFTAFVQTHRKRGTLEERLNESGLVWCWESEYNGKLPYEWIPYENNGDRIQPSNKATEISWNPMGELAAA